MRLLYGFLCIWSMLAIGSVVASYGESLCWRNGMAWRASCQNISFSPVLFRNNVPLIVDSHSHENCFLIICHLFAPLKIKSCSKLAYELADAAQRKQIYSLCVMYNYFKTNCSSSYSSSTWHLFVESCWSTLGGLLFLTFTRTSRVPSAPAWTL